MTSFVAAAVVAVSTGPTTLRVRGELNLLTAPQLQGVIDGTLAGPHDGLALDLPRPAAYSPSRAPGFGHRPPGVSRCRHAWRSERAAG